MLVAPIARSSASFRPRLPKPINHPRHLRLHSNNTTNTPIIVRTYQILCYNEKLLYTCLFCTCLWLNYLLGYPLIGKPHGTRAWIWQTPPLSRYLRVSTNSPGRGFLYMPFILNETKLKTMFKLEFLRLCYLVYNYNYKTDNIALKKRAECLVIIVIWNTYIDLD